MEPQEDFVSGNKDLSSGSEAQNDPMVIRMEAVGITQGEGRWPRRF